MEDPQGAAQPSPFQSPIKVHEFRRQKAQGKKVHEFPGEKYKAKKVHGQGRSTGKEDNKEISTASVLTSFSKHVHVSKLVHLVSNISRRSIPGGCGAGC